MDTGITRGQGHLVAKVTMTTHVLSGMLTMPITIAVAMVMVTIRIMCKVNSRMFFFYSDFHHLNESLICLGPRIAKLRHLLCFVVETAPSRMTPVKHSIPHACIRFGPGGQLVKVVPNQPAEGQPATVEIHDLNEMLQDNPETEELKDFPGPLVRYMYQVLSCYLKKYLNVRDIQTIFHYNHFELPLHSVKFPVNNY